MNRVGSNKPKHFRACMLVSSPSVNVSEFKTKPKASRESVIGRASEILMILRSPVVVESKTMKLIELADKHEVLAPCSPVRGARE